MNKTKNNDEELLLCKEAVHKLMNINNCHRKVMEKQLDSTGVYQSQHRILMEISNKPNQSQKELAEKMNISTATVAVSLKKLEKGGYIIRSADSSDTRYNQVEITKKGREVVEKSKRIFDRVDSYMFYGFKENEIKNLTDILERIINNLKRADL